MYRCDAGFYGIARFAAHSLNPCVPVPFSLLAQQNAPIAVMNTPKGVFDDYPCAALSLIPPRFQKTRKPSGTRKGERERFPLKQTH